MFLDQKKEQKQLKIEYLEILRNFWSNKYIEYKSKNDRNKTLSMEEYLSKLIPQLKDIIDYLKKSEE